MDLKKEIIDILKKETKAEKIQLEIPPDPKLGDYAFPCFQISKEPEKKAKELIKKLKLPGIIEKVEATGPYLNFFINKEELTKLILNEILKENYGCKDIGKNKKIMVEFSSPNSNKPLHIGHLRNQAIGTSISNLLTSTNHKVIKANLINDRGIHICKAMLAYKKWGKNKTPDIKPDHFVGNFYVLYNKKSIESEKYEKEVRKLLQLWENKDPETIELWKKMRDWCIEGFKQTYKLTNTEFDVWLFESDLYGKAISIVKEGISNNVFQNDETGAVIADLEKYGLGKKIILRSDNTSLYITNDLYLTKYKFENYKLDKSYWVVASEQDLYFKQLFRILKLLNYKFATNCYHISYGLVKLPEGKMKSREGKVVDADDLIEDLTKLAKEEIKKRNKNLTKEELTKRALKIALAAINYYLVKVEPSKEILFKPEEAISFEGDTGPYIQYAYARASSILKKAKLSLSKRLIIKEKEEIELIKHLSKFPEVIEDSTNKLKPYLIANYVYELAKKFSNFYEKCPCIEEKDATLKNTRLRIVKATRSIIKKSLNILDIEALEEM